MSATSPPDREATLQARVDLECARIFFGHARGNMLSMLAGASAVAVVMFTGGVSLRDIGLWSLLFSTACAGVLWLEHRVQRHGLYGHNYRRLLRIRIGIGAIASGFYGVSSWLLPDSAPPIQDALLFILLSAVVAVGSLSFAVMPAHYMAISVATLGPLMAHFLQRYLAFGDQIHLLLLVIALGWLGFVLNKAHAASRTAIEAIRLNQNLHDEVEEHKRTREAMRIMAMHDALTGLGNRRYFDQVLKRSVANARRSESRFGLVALDLNEFKPVNDRLGHAAGDQLLQSVALRLKESTREGDFCARLGGDEFAVLMFGPIDQTRMAQATEQLRARFEAVHYLDCVQTALRATASIGWAVYPDDGQEFARLMGVADARMYRDKQSRKAGSAQATADSDLSTARTGDASASTSRSGSAISS
ncbi:diguanylate cyclase [uncultured Sphaerotilus sp.]|uniref:diguanylate cyclase domain-containing protein n=1 Tax=uncultured Sphaerotilus sp. TaxID=474984 RepID=UPI0030CA3436